MLAALSQGGGNPFEAAALWLQVVGRLEDPILRAEAMLNLATALDHTDAEGQAHAMIITDQALSRIGPDHPQACDIYFSAAQRLMRGLAAPDANERARKALHYFHAAIAVPDTAGSPTILAHMLVQYSRAASMLSDFSMLDQAKQVFARCRAAGMRGSLFHLAFSAIVKLHDSRWKATNDMAYLEEALRLSAEAIADVGSPEGKDETHLLAAFQQQRAIMLLNRHEITAEPEDQEEALSLLRSAALLASQPAAILNSLALALMRTAHDLATNEDFEEARRVLDQGIELDASEEERAILRWSLGNWHLAAYQRGGPVSHLDEAIAQIESAAPVLPDRQDDILFSLAHAYRDRFHTEGRAEDIDQAIDYAEQGLALTAPDSADLWRREVTAANAYQDRAMSGGQGFGEDDGERGMALLEAAIERLPHDSPTRANIAAGAIGAYIEQYSMEADPRILDNARPLLRLLPADPGKASALPPMLAVNLAMFYLADGCSGEEREGWLDLVRTVAERHRDSQAGWVAASNLMHQHIGTDWEAVVDAFTLLSNQRQKRFAATGSSRERAMTLRREQNVAAIAGLALVHLGRPAEAAALIDKSQASLLLDPSRPLIPAGDAIWTAFDAIFYPAVTRYGAYVIVATSAGVQGAVAAEELRIDLPEVPGFPDEEAMEATEALLRAAFGAKVPNRLLVIPSGELGLLPWSAVTAGDGPLIDQALLSILPTRDLWRKGTPVRDRRLLLVGGPHAIPSHPLIHSEAEILQLRQWIPEGRTITAKEAETVLAEIPQADIVHFACHGVANSEDPAQSCLYIAENRRLSVDEVAGLECSRVSLVTLSACQSAVYGAGLPDEFASIAVAFLVAGARCVIGTLWNVEDAAASLFSRYFFFLLTQGQTPVEAVRRAQLWLRDTSNAGIAEWLASLGEPATEADRSLRQALLAEPETLRFAHPRYWAAFTCYAGSD